MIKNMQNTSINVKSVTIFHKFDFVIFTFLTSLAVLAGLTFFRYWFSLPAWQHATLILYLLTLFICFNVALIFLNWFLLLRMKRPVEIEQKSDWKVGVVTTYVPASEPIEMLEETVKGLVAMRYPHDTWVLDEGDDTLVKELCERLGAHHFSRKHLSQYQSDEGTFKAHTKYGNVNAWLFHIGFERYDIISSFDPDHVPKSNFLEQVLGYFEDKCIGYVQTAQVYYNQLASFIARGAAEETYTYYSTIQMASYSLGYPIITGCHNTHRVEALKEVNGFAAHDADDLLITLNYRSHGWHGVYVPKVLAKGLTPVDWNGYLKQQRRWARSVLDIKFRVFPKLANDLPLATRAISAVHGLNYLIEPLIPVAGIMILMFLLMGGSNPLLSTLMVPKFFIFIIILQFIEFYRQRFFLLPRQEWGLHWRARLLRYAKWPYFLLALFDVVINRKVPYVITAKKSSQSHRKLILWPHLAIAIFMAIAMIIGLIRGQEFELSIHIWALCIITISLILFFTQFTKFPVPFEQALIPKKDVIKMG